jgi:uracil-DNA glycosylase
MYQIRRNLNKEWSKKLYSEFTKPYFKELEQFLSSEDNYGKIIYPNQKHVFQCFNKTPFSSVKVVILGQDPYHGEGQAHGLSFSVTKNIKIPPSLKNIFKELSDDLNITTPANGNLEKWAEQGILLLNTVLTVEQAKANSHRKKGWEIFTDKVIQTLNDDRENLVFVLWGSLAQKKGKSINKKKHLVLESPHPSPLSSYRGFFESKPFSKINSYLKKKKISEISWDL